MVDCQKTAELIRWCPCMGYNTYGIIREVTKTHAVQENWGRAKAVPLQVPQLYPYK
jgi:hypothetical protein